MTAIATPADLPCPHCGENKLTEPSTYSSFVCTGCGAEAWIELGQDEDVDGICIPCANGYHEHHRQAVYVFPGEKVSWGEPDCKNTFRTGGQCMCYQQPHGNTRLDAHVGYHPYCKVTVYDGEFGPHGISQDGDIECEGCIRMISERPNFAGRGLHICPDCGQAWEVINRCAWSWAWTKGGGEPREL